MRRVLLLCLPLLLGADLPEAVDPEHLLGHYVDGLFPDAAGRTPPVEVQLRRTPGTGVVAVVSGGVTREGRHRGVVVALTACPEVVCYGPHTTLPDLWDGKGPTLHPVVDLAGEPGPLLRETTSTEGMSHPVLPIVTPYRNDHGSGQRLVLLSLRDGTTRLLSQDIEVLAHTGRRQQASDLALVRGAGDTLELTFTWQVWPGGDDHDAGCLHEPVARRFVLERDRWFREAGAPTGCR